jgi:uncharacterized membrane protein/Mg-chelatase subunit ChlD
MAGLAAYWLSGFVGIWAGWLALRRQWAGASTLGALALGALVPFDVALYVGGAALFALVGLLIALIASGGWAPRLAALVGLCLAASVGGLTLVPLTQALNAAGRAAASVDVAAERTAFVGGLVVEGVAIAVVLLLSRRSLAALGPWRRRTAIALRCLLVTGLVFALMEPRYRQANDRVTVLFLVDRSLSVPHDADPNAPPDTPSDKRDLRWKRVQTFVSDAVGKRGAGHERDQAGVILFGRRPRLVLSPSDAPRLALTEELQSGLDYTYTDIGAALKLALASFPEGSAKRVVLLSDGNENLGSALEQARLAERNGVQVDVVPLAEGYSTENEVLVQAVEAPPVSEQGSRLPIRVLLRNAHKTARIRGTLVLRQIAEGESVPIPIIPGPSVLANVGEATTALVELQPGLNSFAFRQKVETEGKSYTYQATFQPVEMRNARGQLVQKGLPGDRVQNNSATTHVVTLGQRRVLFVEAANGKGKQELLLKTLRGPGAEPKFKVHAITSKDLPTSVAELGVFLSSFDCVILANVPADELTENQQEVLRTNTADQGCGLIMVGGPESFGAGGYQGTAIEKALPVDCDVNSVQVAGKSGLVLIMHASEIANGNAIQKKVAQLAVQRLSSVDMMGMLYYSFNVTWHINFQTVGKERNALYTSIDRMSPGDMPDFDPALVMAEKELSNPAHNLATKHVIVISDGDPQLGPAGNAALQRMVAGGITCTTVGVATHGPQEDSKMAQIAQTTKGRYYGPNTTPGTKDPANLPAIYIRETRLISQAFIHEKRFVPKLVYRGGPTDKLPGALPALHGFVRTTLKPTALAEMGIEGPPTAEQRFPILAYWQYGLGRAVAFTSDARSQTAGQQGWDRDWAGSDVYLKFWEQVVAWTMRGVETDKLRMYTEYRDGKVRVLIDARDEANGKPLTDLILEGRVSTPNARGDKPVELKFEQKSGGQYEAEFKADEAGSYFVNALAKRKVLDVGPDGKPKRDANGNPIYKQVPLVGRDGQAVVDANGQPKTRDAEDVMSVRAGVTLPYSPEFADLESNPNLLKRLAEITGGNVYAEDDLPAVARAGTVFRRGTQDVRSVTPLWHWFVWVVAIGFVLDVAIRRIAVEPEVVRKWAVGIWERLRRRAVTASAPDFLARLQTRKAQVGEQLAEETRQRRFETSSAPVAPLPDAPTASSPPPPPRVPAPPPPPTATGGTFADRLLQAKRKAQEKHTRPKDEEPPA